MKRAKYLIDTVILVDHLNGIAKATKWLASVSSDECAISVVTRAEVLTGTTEKERAAVNLLLDRYNCLPIIPSVADKAAELRRTYRWKLPDAFQAAIAVRQSLLLVTRNTKDFPQKKYAFVLTPYVL